MCLGNTSGIPKPSFRGSITRVDAKDTRGVISFPDDTIVPDILEDRLSSPLVSVTIMNTNMTMYKSEPIPETFYTPRRKEPKFLFQKRDDISIAMDEEWDGWVRVVSVECFTQDNVQVFTFQFDCLDQNPNPSLIFNPDRSRSDIPGPNRITRRSNLSKHDKPRLPRCVDGTGPKEIHVFSQHYLHQYSSQKLG